MNKNWLWLNVVIPFCMVVFIATIFALPSRAAVAHRIVLLETFDLPVILEHTRFFLCSMEKLGYRKDEIRILKAQGDPKRAERLLLEAIRNDRPDIIVSNATLASQAAHTISVAHKIPMVFFVVSDPVGAGIVSKVNAPSRQLITGIVHSVPRETKIEMVMRILKPLQHDGRPIRFGFIHSSYPSARGDLRMLREAAGKRTDVKFIAYEIPYHEQNFNIQQTMALLAQGIEELEPEIDFWWIPQDPVGELEEFVETLSKHSRHPIVCGTNPGSIKHGALMYIAADTEEGARETASMVDLILKGTAAGSIPIHAPAKIDYGVNLSTAIKMGVAIPSDLLTLAGQNITR